MVMVKRGWKHRVAEPVKGSDMKERRMSVFNLGLFFFLFIFYAQPLFAAVGAARLTLQKTAVVGDKTESYVIRKGDTISGIIRRQMGINLPYEAVRKLNPHIPDLNRVYPGQKLILPSIEEEEDGKEAGLASIRDYTVKKGDSITRIILYELGAKPKELPKKLRLIKQLNPDIENLNKIRVGQPLKIPDGKAEDYGKETAASALATQADNKAALPVQTGAVPQGNLNLIAQIIKQLNGTLITNGNYYIPLSQSGQATIDCTTIPVAELDDGTTILLDLAGRFPDALVKMIHTSWGNYHFVKMDKGEGVSSLLQKIIRPSHSYAMTKMEKPLLLGDEPEVKLILDWSIAKRAPEGKTVYNMGLVFPADKTWLLPEPILAYAKKKGITICEILDDKARVGAGDAAYSSTVAQLQGGTNEEMLYNFLNLLGLAPLKDREVKIFDTARDGFNLSVKAELLVKTAGKTIFIHKSRLPQQFMDLLKAEGTEPVYLAPDMSRRAVLENALSALGIPFHFALYSFPERNEKARGIVSFSALKIGGGEPLYLIDFDMAGEMCELLLKNWGLKIIRY